MKKCDLPNKPQLEKGFLDKNLVHLISKCSPELLVLFVDTLVFPSSLLQPLGGSVASPLLCRDLLQTGPHR